MCSQSEVRNVPPMSRKDLQKRVIDFIARIRISQNSPEMKSLSACLAALGLMVAEYRTFYAESAKLAPSPPKMMDCLMGLMKAGVMEEQNQLDKCSDEEIFSIASLIVGELGNLPFWLNIS